jgi:hypothetical protein
MPKLLVARHRQRRGFFIPMLGNKSSPSLLFPLDGVDNEELDALVRAILARQGVTNEAEINAVVEQAERDSEIRRKVQEARVEVRRLMALRASGHSLIQRGFRIWKEAFFPAVKRFKGQA